MELTPAQEQFENQVRQSPTICRLEEEGKKLIKGQNSIQEHLNEVDDRLEDGSKVMKGLIDDVKNVFDLIENANDKSAERHKESMAANSELKIEIKDNKYKDLKATLEERNAEVKKKDDEIKDGRRKRWELAMKIVTGFISLAVGIALATYYK